jgi:hypothetical protein
MKGRYGASSAHYGNTGFGNKILDFGFWIYFQQVHVGLAMVILKL